MCEISTYPCGAGWALTYGVPVHDDGRIVYVSAVSVGTSAFRRSLFHDVTAVGATIVVVYDPEATYSLNRLSATEIPVVLFGTTTSIFPSPLISF
jgi:hypothetical protein